MDDGLDPRIKDVICGMNQDELEDTIRKMRAFIRRLKAISHGG